LHVRCVQVLRELLDGISGAVVRGTRRGVKLNATEEALQSSIMQYGGPLAMDIFAMNMEGSHRRTIQKRRAADFTMRYGFCEDVVDAVVGIFKR
jgi:hypothetical protein